MLHDRIRRVATGLAIAVLTLLLVPSLVLGHAELENANPDDKSTVTEPVPFVSGRFSEGMKSDGSSLIVKDGAGTVVAEGIVDPANDERMVATPASPLGNGTYRVEWTSVSSEDGDIARGVWTFTVAVAPTASPTAVPTPPPSAAPSASASPGATPTAAPATTAPSLAPTPVPSPSADGSNTGSGGDVVLPIIVALIILGAGAAYLLTRRNRPADQA